MKGWAGKILRVDLSNGTYKTEDLDPEAVKMYLGGHGYATKILMDEIDPKVDGLSPDNKLIFSIGPLTGTIAPLASRYMVTTKSPLTGLLGFGNSGGFFGPEMSNMLQTSEIAYLEGKQKFEALEKKAQNFKNRIASETQRALKAADGISTAQHHVGIG